MEFEDGSQVLAKREDVYTLDEDLPKKVKRRLVSIRLTVQNIILQQKWNTFMKWSFCSCSLVSCSVVDGFKHAFPGCLLHYAGGEEKTEDAQFAFPEGFCGTSRPPYHCQKRVRAAEPQREIKWQDEGRAADRCTETGGGCGEEAVCVWVTHWSHFHPHPLCPCDWGQKKRKMECVMWGWMDTNAGALAELESE